MGQPWMNDTIPRSKISSLPWERLGVFDHLVGDATAHPGAALDEEDTYAPGTAWRSVNLKL